MKGADMRTKYEIERINERLDRLETGHRILKSATEVALFKDKNEFDGRGDSFGGREVGWKMVDIADLLKLIFNHLNLKYISKSTVPESVVKKSK